MTILIWTGFLLLILTLLVLDLSVFHRKTHVIGLREALLWTLVWVALALGFNGFVYFLYGTDWFAATEDHSVRLSAGEAAIQYFTGYLVEYSLSMDNVFVIALILAYFQVPPAEQHRVLFWGILGAIVFRGLFIAAGAALIHQFEWILAVFGVFLVATALKMLFTREGNVDPERNLFFRLCRRLFPITGTYHGSRFFVKQGDRWAATPLFLCLVLIESTDVVFAVDSVPAIFGITREPFLVFTSNVFAILGLRSLYFALAGVVSLFRFLKVSLVVILVYIGVKMVAEVVIDFHIPNLASLAVIGATLALGILASLLAPAGPPTRFSAETDAFHPTLAPPRREN